MLQDPALVTSETYKLKAPTFENGKLEEFPYMMNNFKTATDRTGTTSATRKIHFLRTMVHREYLIEFDDLVGQAGSTTNGHINPTKEGLIGYFPPIKSLTKQKREMRRAMKKPWDILFKRFAARLTELNKNLPLLPGSSATKNINPEELNKIILQAVPKSRGKQAYLQGWDFEESPYKDTCDMIECTEIAESIYEGGSPSQNNQQ